MTDFKACLTNVLALRIIGRVPHPPIPPVATPLELEHVCNDSGNSATHAPGYRAFMENLKHFSGLVHYT